MRCPILALTLVIALTVFSQTPVVSFYPIGNKAYKDAAWPSRLAPFATKDHVVACERTGADLKEHEYHFYVFDREQRTELHRGKLTFPSSMTRLSTVLLLDDVPYIIYNAWGEEGTMDVFAVRLVLPEVALAGEPKRLASIPYHPNGMSDWPWGLDYWIAVSPDGEKILMHLTCIFSKKDVKPLRSWVFSSDFDLLWQGEYEIDVEEDGPTTEAVGVNNDGVGYALMRGYGTTAVPNPRVRTVLRRMTAEGITFKVLEPAPEHYVHSADLIVRDADILVAGFEGKTSGRTSTHAFTTVLDLDLEPTNGVQRQPITNADKDALQFCTVLDDADGTIHLVGHDPLPRNVFVVALSSNGDKLWETPTPLADVHGAMTPHVSGGTLALAYFEFPSNIDDLKAGKNGGKTRGYLMEPAACLFDDKGTMRVERLITGMEGVRDVLVQSGSSFGQWRQQGLFFTFMATKEHQGVVMVELE